MTIRWTMMAAVLSAGLLAVAATARADDRGGGWGRVDRGGRGHGPAQMQRGGERGRDRFADRDREIRDRRDLDRGDFRRGRGPAVGDRFGRGFDGRADLGRRDGREQARRPGDRLEQFRKRLADRLDEWCKMREQRGQINRRDSRESDRGRGFGPWGQMQRGPQMDRGRQFGLRGQMQRGPQMDRGRDGQADLKGLAEKMRPLLDREQNRKLDELLKAGEPVRPDTRRPELRRPEGFRAPELPRMPERLDMRRPDARPDARPDIRLPNARPDARPEGRYMRGPDGQWRFQRGGEEREGRRPAGEDRVGRRVQELVENYQKAIRDASPEKRAELQRKLVREMRELSEKD